MCLYKAVERTTKLPYSRSKTDMSQN